MTREELYETAIDLLQSGHCVEILGEKGSGRTHLLRQVSRYFEELGWHAIELSGIWSAKNADFAALDLAGVLDESSDRNSSFTSVYRSLASRVQKQPSVILIDDVEWLDDASRAVVNAVNLKLGVPVIFARSAQTLSREVSRVTGSSAVYSLTIEGMSFTEMETALGEILDATVEPVTMSLIFAETGGNIGLAQATVEAGRRAGNIEVEEGVARAVGPLWTPILSPLADAILQQLSEEDLSALRTLAFLGAADLGTVSKLIPREQILRLEERSFLTLLESRNGMTAMLQQPLLVEYFRKETKLAQRAETIQLIEAELAYTQSFEMPIELIESGNSALLVRLVHEKTRLKTLRAQEAWFRERSLATASIFLSALRADPSRSEKDISSLIADVSTLDGVESERIEWELAYALYRAQGLGERIAAARHLDELAKRHPAYAPRLEAQSLLIQWEFGALPDTEPLAGIDPAGLEGESQLMVLLARSTWLVARGRVHDADALLRDFISEESSDPRLITLQIYTKISLGQGALAAHIAQKRFTRAVINLEARSIRAFAFMRGVVATFVKELEGVEQALETASSIGAAAGAAPSSYVGLTVMSARFAAKENRLSKMRQYLAEVDAAGGGDGLLLGMQRSLVYSQAEASKAHMEAASRICREDGDVMWQRGARLAAAHAYIESMIYMPDPEQWEELSVRIQEVDSPLLGLWMSFMDPLLRGDQEKARSVFEDADDDDEHVSVVRLAQMALKTLEGGRGTRKNINPMIQSLDDLLSVAGPTDSADTIVLSARDREVAELIAAGLSSPSIAGALGLNVRTVESRVNRLMKKIGARNSDDIRAFLRENTH